MEATLRRVAMAVVGGLAVAGFMALPAYAHHGKPGGSGAAAGPAGSAAAQGGTASNPIAALLGALSPPPPAPAAPPPAAPAFQPMAEGATGENVKALEQRLVDLKYFLPAVDTTYDADTAHAVIAFQKTNNMARTGKVDQATWSALQNAKDPAPLVANGGAHRVEIDLGRQVLFLYEGGKLSKIFAISSGTEETPTPTGDYKVYSKSTGWETSALGQLYNSQYFVGGYAMHGSKSVPTEPASHGCVRLTMAAADWFPDHVNIGTPVFIRD